MEENKRINIFEAYLMLSIAIRKVVHPRHYMKKAREGR
jgi:hypothetical protein